MVVHGEAADLQFPLQQSHCCVGVPPYHRHTIVIHTSHIRWVLSIFSPECFIFLCFQIVHFGPADVPVTHFFRCPASPLHPVVLLLLKLDYLPLNHLLRISASRSLCHRNSCAEVKTSDPFYRGLKSSMTYHTIAMHTFPSCEIPCDHLITIKHHLNPRLWYRSYLRHAFLCPKAISGI